MAHGEKRSLILRAAVVALTILGLTIAVVVGVLVERAVSAPAEALTTSSATTPLLVPSVLTRQDRKESEWPQDDALAEAERIARSRSGVVSFAAIGPDGETVGFEPNRQFFSASVAKSMLLVAELRRLRRDEVPLDGATRTLLEQMITISDNDAADAIYARVGDPGLNEVAAATGMTGFEGDVGHWSNAMITPADMALFMSKLDGLLDLPYGDAGSEMLASVTPTQQWGIPQALAADAKVRLKGGWRPSDSGELVHQAARVDVGDQSYSVAVLTDGNPTQVYGQETIRSIASALLRGTPASK